MEGEYTNPNMYIIYKSMPKGEKRRVRKAARPIFHTYMHLLKHSFHALWYPQVEIIDPPAGAVPGDRIICPGYEGVSQARLYICVCGFICTGLYNCEEASMNKQEGPYVLVYRKKKEGRKRDDG